MEKVEFSSRVCEPVRSGTGWRRGEWAMKLSLQTVTVNVSKVRLDHDLRKARGYLQALAFFLADGHL